MFKLTSPQHRLCLLCRQNRTNWLVDVPKQGLIPVCKACLPQVELLPIMYELAE